MTEHRPSKPQDYEEDAEIERRENRSTEKEVSDKELLEALARLYDNLSRNQKELDPDAKRILYENMEKLYVR